MFTIFRLILVWFNNLSNICLCVYYVRVTDVILTDSVIGLRWNCLVMFWVGRTNPKTGEKRSCVYVLCFALLGVAVTDLAGWPFVCTLHNWFVRPFILIFEVFRIFFVCIFILHFPGGRCNWYLSWWHFVCTLYTNSWFPKPLFSNFWFMRFSEFLICFACIYVLHSPGGCYNWPSCMKFCIYFVAIADLQDILVFFFRIFEAFRVVVSFFYCLFQTIFHFHK